MDGLDSGDLAIRVDRSVPECLRLDWLGRSNSRNPAPIVAPFFEKLLTEAKASGRFIEMHFEGLEYFNSSTITVLIHLIQLAVKAVVALRIYYNAERTWQTLSFDALKRSVGSSAKGEWPRVEFFGTYGRGH